MHPTPLTLALWALGALTVAVLVFTASRARLRAVWRAQFAETRRERLFLASVGFFLTFTIVRALTHAIRAGRGPFHNLETARGLHIHHMVWGILLLLLIGYCWLVRIGTGEGGTSTWLGRFLSLLYGAGAALTLDEFALWLNLRDVYWEREGRESIGAVFLFGSLLSMGVWGAPFLRGLGRELARLVRRGTGRGFSRAKGY